MPDVRLEDEEVVLEELTALLEVAEVRLVCAYTDEAAISVTNPNISVGRNMVAPA